MAPPLAKMGAPYMNVGAPHANMAAPYMNMASPHANMASPHANMASPHANMASPHANMASQTACIKYNQAIFMRYIYKTPLAMPACLLLTFCHISAPVEKNLPPNSHCYCPIQSKHIFL
jgi:hypothetical protein